MSDTNVTIRFVSGGEWDSRLIKYWTECEWSHVEAVQGGRTFGAMFKGGVKWREFTDPEYRNIRRTKIVEVPCSVAQVAAFWKFSLAQEGKPYDKAAIVSFSPVLRLVVKDRNWEDDAAWFCSEEQFGAFNAAGRIVVPKDTAIISYSPRDLWVVLEQEKLGRRVTA